MVAPSVARFHKKGRSAGIVQKRRLEIFIKKNFDQTYALKKLLVCWAESEVLCTLTQKQWSIK